MEDHKTVGIVVPLWTIIATMGAIGISAFGWLFIQLADLQDQIVELHKLLHEVGIM